MSSSSTASVKLRSGIAGQTTKMSWKLHPLSIAKEDRAIPFAIWGRLARGKHSSCIGSSSEVWEERRSAFRSMLDMGSFSGFPPIPGHLVADGLQTKFLTLFYGVLLR